MYIINIRWTEQIFGQTVDQSGWTSIWMKSLQIVEKPNRQSVHISLKWQWMVLYQPGKYTCNPVFQTFLIKSCKAICAWENLYWAHLALECLTTDIDVQVGVSISTADLQSGKTYCTAFCASLALLAGSGNNASFN